ncbi:hypothetical protein SAMN05421493_11828 [Pseudobutyrivibrio sp. 49]|uniref:hypothetical protein n=1 Tax=Pseudobutyrivibrio sp. 49 TaxID=1855344 RepID=UPI00088FA92B|nr:hypothetical protein [Pseudobutyrivibrio sp. 49]SDI56542.1 hypothetical protein SAMN05421493_11828 [Pseudobutyrivibrio sp. 49]
MTEQEIAKYQILANIIQVENNRVKKGGVSFLGTSDLAEWFELTEEEVKDFWEVVAALDEDLFPRNEIRNYKTISESASPYENDAIYMDYYHAFWVVRRMLVFSHLGKYSEDEKIWKMFIEDKVIGDDEFNNALNVSLNDWLDLVEQFSKEYDVRVISKIVGMENDLVSLEQVQELKEHFKDYQLIQ